MDRDPWKSEGVLLILNNNLHDTVSSIHRCGYTHTQTHTSFIKVSVYTRNNNSSEMIVMSENSKLSKYFHCDV